MWKLIQAACIAAVVANCSHQPLSPVQLVGNRGAEVAIKEFLYHSKWLASLYGLNLDYKEEPTLNIARQRANSDVFGFPLRHDIAYTVAVTTQEVMPPEQALNHPRINDMRAEARSAYIKSGAYASQILCRNYLGGLREKNEYFEFLQKELGIAGGLANITLELADANGTLRTAVAQSLTSLNLGVDAYQSFRFLTPEIETILPIVEEAQVTLRDYFLKNPPATFAGAINAVSQIEYHCTRAGVRSLLNKTLIQSRPQFGVKDGILYAKPVEKVPETKPANK